jgi:hypothetical protein
MEPAWACGRPGGSLIGMQTTLIHIALAKANTRGRR